MKRWLVRIFVLLFLGAIVNVAVAWGIGFVAAARDERLRDQRLIDELVRIAQFSGSHLVLGPHEMRICVWTSDQRGNPEFSADRKLPTWSTSYGGEPLANFCTDLAFGEGVSSYEYAAGWPILCVRYSEVTRRIGGVDSLVSVAGRAIDVPEPIREWRAGAKLPTLPIWPGFAINTIFYATLLWLIFFMPFALRRHRRIKRGLCPKCAYDLRAMPADSNACPECGAPVHPPLRAGVRGRVEHTS